MENIRDYLGKNILFYDGGTGSVLQSKGLQPGELPENWNIKRPTEIIELNYSYFLAGSNIVNTNTFGAFSTKFTGKDGTYSLKQIIDSAFENSKKALSMILEKDKEQNINIPRFIAFDIGSCGKLLKPLGDLEFEKAVLLFKETFDIALNHKPDVITIETINDIYEIKAAIIAAKESLEEKKLDIPIFASLVYDEGQKTLTGSSPEICCSILESLGVSAIGLNCSLGPSQMKPIVSKLIQSTSLPILVKPNAGLPKSQNGKTIYDVTEDDFTKILCDFAKDGAAILGGCCGTTPSYIKKLISKISENNIKY